ncbi:MAG: hypothetical protein HY835_12065 [Anaerolineae bacterium]|nr:hypothetical protein [Anaerolineae bacterium]
MFFEPPEDARPPAEVRVTDLRVEPWPDGQRVKVFVNLTPFQQRPNLIATISNAAGDELSSTTIVEAMDTTLVFTMHLRIPEPQGDFTLGFRVEYPDLPVIDHKEVSFHL